MMALAYRSLSLIFMLVFCLSITTSSSSASTDESRRECGAKLLSFLGSEDQQALINNEAAEQFKSCLKFLVPFSPTDNTIKTHNSSSTQWRRDLLNDDQHQRAENERIWWPPTAVLELARNVVDSGGDPRAIHAALDSTVLPVLPDIEGSNGATCVLATNATRFVNEELNTYFAFLFELILARGPSKGLDVSLNRYDLFHGHLFIARSSNRLGILFHAMEYPAYDERRNPHYLGPCQTGSNVAYNAPLMNLRNILWLAPLPSSSTEDWLAPGVLVDLDARPQGIIYEDLIEEGVQHFRTIYEGDFGKRPIDVNYLNVGSEVADYRIFITKNPIGA